MKQVLTVIGMILGVAGLLVLSDRIGLSNFVANVVTGGKQSDQIFEAYKNTKVGRDNELGSFCIQEANRQTSAAAKGQEFQFLNASGNDVSGRYIVQASAAFVTILNPTTYGAPNVLVTCEFDGNRLIAIHQIRSVDR